jgi:hypothetical protein
MASSLLTSLVTISCSIRILLNKVNYFYSATADDDGDDAVADDNDRNHFWF